jgi:hypothetical protein
VGPRVRIRLAPAASPRTLGPFRARAGPLAPQLMPGDAFAVRSFPNDTSLEIPYRPVPEQNLAGCCNVGLERQQKWHFYTGVGVQVSPIRHSCQTLRSNHLLRRFSFDVSFSLSLRFLSVGLPGFRVETISRGDRSPRDEFSIKRARVSLTSAFVAALGRETRYRARRGALRRFTGTMGVGEESTVRIRLSPALSPVRTTASA